MRFPLAPLLSAMVIVVVIPMLNAAIAADRSLDVLGVKVGVELTDGIEILDRQLSEKRYKLHRLDATHHFKTYLSRDFCRTHLPMVAGLQDSIVVSADYQTISLHFDGRERRPKIHTIIRVLDLQQAGIGSDDILAALEHKFGKPTKRGRHSIYHSWGQCATEGTMLEPIGEKRSSQSLALSPKEISASRKNRDCISKLRNNDTGFDFFFGTSKTKSEGSKSISVGQVLNEGEYIDSSTGEIKKGTLHMFMPGNGLNVPNECGRVAFVKFFDVSYPKASRKAMIVVSSTEELTLTMRRTIRKLKSSSQSNNGKGDVKF